MADTPTGKMNFDKSCYTTVDLSSFNPNEYFEEYHHWVEFNKDHTYDKKSFKAVYRDNTERTYEYTLYTVGDTNGVYIKRHFVVAEEQLSANDVKELKHYCQCIYHTSSWFNPLSYFICPCCVGCLHSEFPRQSVINETREYIDRQDTSSW